MFVWHSSEPHDKAAMIEWLDQVHPTGPYTRGGAVDDAGRVWLLECVNNPDADPNERSADALWMVTAHRTRAEAREGSGEIIMHGEITVSGPRPIDWEPDDVMVPLTRWVQLPAGTPLPPIMVERVT